MSLPELEHSLLLHLLENGASGGIFSSDQVTSYFRPLSELSEKLNLTTDKDCIEAFIKTVSKLYQREVIEGV